MTVYLLTVTLFETLSTEIEVFAIIYDHKYLSVMPNWHLFPLTKSIFKHICIEMLVRSAYKAIWGQLMGPSRPILAVISYMWLEWHLLTVTLFPRHVGVTVSGDICINTLFQLVLLILQSMATIFRWIAEITKSNGTCLSFPISMYFYFDINFPNDHLKIMSTSIYFILGGNNQMICDEGWCVKGSRVLFGLFISRGRW